MRKKNPGVISFATVLTAIAAVAWAADPAAINPTPETPTTQNAPVDQTAAIDQTAPVVNWTEFKGTINHIDLHNKIVQIRETSTDTLIDVPVNQNVSIYKRDHKYSLGDLKEGDKVTIRNDAAT